MSRARKTPLVDYKPHRIALIKPSALGDVIHALPVATAIKQRFPDAYLCWVVNRAYEPLLLNHPDLDATLPFDRAAVGRGVGKGTAAYFDFMLRFRRLEFDLVVDLQNLLRSGVMAAASGAKRRVGLSSAREGARWFYTDIVDVGDFNAIHAVDRYWLAAEALGAGAGPKRFRLTIPENEQQWAESFLQSLPRPWLVLGPGSRWVTKRWLPAHFAALARQALETFGGTAILVGGKDEVEISRQTADQIDRGVRDLTGETTLPRLAALLQRADVMISNDTGPLHLAAALGRPVVAPYTCTSILLNGPYGGEQGAVETRVSCQGSYVKNCSRMDCMTELTPERLWPKLHGVLHTWQRRHSA